jgi:hypothetical protein
MQTKDMTVGTEYAYQSSKHSDRYRVRVLAVNVTETVKANWGAAKRVTGVKIEFTDPEHYAHGKVKIVRPVTIVHTWAEEAAEREANARYADEAARRKAETLAANARTAFALHQLLAAKGVPVTTGYSYDDNICEALKAAGFKPVDAHTFESTIYALGDAVGGIRTPSVPTALLAALFE